MYCRMSIYQLQKIQAEVSGGVGRKATKDACITEMSPMPYLPQYTVALKVTVTVIVRVTER